MKKKYPIIEFNSQHIHLVYRYDGHIICHKNTNVPYFQISPEKYGYAHVELMEETKATAINAVNSIKTMRSSLYMNNNLSRNISLGCGYLADLSVLFGKTLALENP